MIAVSLCATAALLFAVVSAQQPPSAQASVAENIKSNLQRRWIETWAQGGESSVSKESGLCHTSLACSGHETHGGSTQALEGLSLSQLYDAAPMPAKDAHFSRLGLSRSGILQCAMALSDYVPPCRSKWHSPPRMRLLLLVPSLWRTRHTTGECNFAGRPHAARFSVPCGITEQDIHMCGITIFPASILLCCAHFPCPDWAAFAQVSA